MNRWSYPRKRPKASYVFSGTKLRTFRQRSNFSLTRVSEMTGISTSSISDYECGRIVPQVHQLKKLCEVYNLDPFEVCELIRFEAYDSQKIRTFREACRRQGLKPKQALEVCIVYYGRPGFMT